MSRMLTIIVGVLALSGCAVTGPAVVPSSVSTEAPTTATTATPAKGELEKLLGDWDSSVADSDEVGLFLVTLSLPGAVEGECYPALTEDQRATLSGDATAAAAEIDQVTADTGGVRAIDIYTAWRGYVEMSRFLCGY